MTARLYQPNSFAQTFTTHIAQSFLHDGKPAVILNQTAFYPGVGGQPNDAGTLNGVALLDVFEREDGEIVHVLAAPLAGLADEAVTGEIAWPRRFDHMQQHSGQHILSAAFVKTCALDTIAVHMPADDPDGAAALAGACTLDLPSAKVSAEMAQRAEDAANAVIFADTPIVAYEVGDADLSAIPLRKPPKVTGRIRIVEVKDFDWSACGGTHVRSAGQIGQIRIAKLEKRGNETRVYFRCGGRALRDYRRASAITAQLAELLSAGPMELASAITRLKDDAAARHKALQEAQAKLLVYEAKELAEAAPARGDARVVARAWAGRDAAHIRALAKAITSQPGMMALLAGVGEKTALVFARSGDLSADMRPLLQDALAKLQEPGEPAPRGGGTPDLAQGGLAKRDADAVQRMLDQMVS